MHFAHAGAFIFTLSVLTAGLLLATDYHLLRMAAVTTRVSGRSLAQLGKLGQAATQQSKKKIRVKTDLEEGVDLDGDEDESGAADELAEETDEDREIRVRTPADKAEEAAAKNEKEEDSRRGRRIGRRFGRGIRGRGSDVCQRGLEAGERNQVGTGIKNRRQQPGQAQKSERQELIEQLEAADQQIDEEIAYELPPLDLLLPNEEVSYEEHEKEVRQRRRILEKTFKDFGFNVRVVEIDTGPVIAQYEVELEAGLRLSKISGLADDLAIALRVPSVRIVAPIPGKNTVGIEVPNENRQWSGCAK